MRTSLWQRDLLNRTFSQDIPVREKSILPGVANRKTVLANHCSAFIASPAARTGILEGNPIHADMVWAARAARLAFVVNAVINEKKEAVYVVAGDMEKAHGGRMQVFIRPVRCGGQTCGHCGYHKWWIPARPEHLSGGQGYGPPRKRR